MMLIEVFAPQRTFGPDDRVRLGERLIEALTTTPSAPEDVLDTARSLCHVLVHEPAAWITGGADEHTPPRFLVRVHVADAWRREMAAYISEKITRVLAEETGSGDRLFERPDAWVHVIGVKEGSYAMFGRVLDSSELTRMITEPYRTRRDADDREPPEGHVIDPVCGMIVELSDTAITLEHDGTTYGFCAPGCRKVFAGELAEASA